MYKKTKIVATISDVRCDVGLIQRLYDAGMNVVRLNTAHQDATGMKRVIDNVREVSSHLAILVDTKGPEVRTTVTDVNKLLKQFEMMQKMMKQFKKSPKGFARRLGGLMGNPNAFKGLK